MKKYRLHIFVLIFILLAGGMPFSAAAADDPDLPVVAARSFILMEPESGNILYAKNERQRDYPASMTKILSAIIVMEHIAPDEIVIAGDEVSAIPWDSSKAGHVKGEAITGENILRGLIIPSGNETACIAAVAITKKLLGEDTVSYARAERTFADLMNEKAKELGAVDSNFVNPHGYHNDNHYSTAYDMALIAREAMKYDLIMRIAAETLYEGESAGENPPPGLMSVWHSWPSHNSLIKPGPYNYPYATGLKTGWMDQSGECLTATATKNGISLITVTFDSPVDEEKNPTRWSDNRNLFEYGFNNFATETIVTAGEVLGAVPINNPRLGDSGTLEYLAADTVTDFLSEKQLAAVTRDIAFNPELVDSESQELMLNAPVGKGDVIGSVAYMLDSELIFLGDIVAGRDVLKRTFNSDVDYYIASAKAALFSAEAVPYWIIALMAVIIVVMAVFMIRSRRRGRRGRGY